VSTYFQFPLCLLAYGKDEVRLEHIISWCLVEAGRDFCGKMSRESQDEIMKQTPSHNIPEGMRRGELAHRHVVVGANKLSVTAGDVGAILNQYVACSNFVKAFTDKHGTQPSVRIRSDFLWDVREKRGMSYREFSMLCGLYSVVGAKDFPVRITREQIRRRMLGYKSEAVLKAELGNRTDGAMPLSVRQIGCTRDELHKRGFFACTRPNKRQTYYSIRMNQEQLAARLESGKSYAEDFHARRKARDAALMARIKAAKAAKAAIKVDKAIIVNTPIIVDKVRADGLKITADSPLDVHLASTAPSTPMSTGASTLIETIGNRNSPIETLSAETGGTQTACARVEDSDSEKGGAAREPTLSPPNMEELVGIATRTCAGSKMELPVADLAKRFWEKEVVPGTAGENWKARFVLFVTRETL